MNINDKEFIILRYIFRNEKNIRQFLFHLLYLLNEKNDTKRDESMRNFGGYLIDEINIFNDLLYGLNKLVKENPISKNSNEYCVIKFKNLYYIYFEILTRSDFINIISKYFISSNKDFYLRISVNNEKERYFMKNENQIKIENNNQNPNPIKIQTLNVNPIKTFILNIYEKNEERKKQKKTLENFLKENQNRDQKDLKSEIKKLKQLKDPKNYFYDILNYNNLQIENTYEKDEIIIILRLPSFDIILKLPFNEVFNLDNFNFMFRIDVFGKYQILENINIKNKLLLYKKLKNFFQDLIKNFCRIIYEERIKSSINNININIFDNDFLINILILFADYLNNYNLIFKTSCDLCGKKAKYSNNEKCFFPPYCKIFFEKEFFALNNKMKFIGKNSPKFFHEDCFQKINLKEININV